MDNVDDDFTPQEKAAYVAFRFAEGRTFSTQEVADTFGITYQGAYMMLNRISRVIPIAPDDNHPCPGGQGSRWSRITP